MTRLIDADKLTREACVKFYTTPYYKHILDLIDNAPTVVNEYTNGFADGERSGRHFPLTDEEKAILVRQLLPKGKWILKETDYDDGGNNLYECSNCHYSDTHSGSIEVPYCWHCGAEMRGRQ